MAFNVLAPLNALETRLAAVAGVGATQLGAPGDIDETAHAYIALAGGRVEHETTESLVWWQRYFVGFAYRVLGTDGTSVEPSAIETAEQSVATWLAAFVKGLYTVAGKTLDSTCVDCRVDLSLGDSPQYEVRGGMEYRVYPVIVICKLRDSFPPA